MGRTKPRKCEKTQAAICRSKALKKFLVVHVNWADACVGEEKKPEEWRVEDMQGVTVTMVKAKSKDALYRHYLRKVPQDEFDTWEEKLESFPGFPNKSQEESQSIVDQLIHRGKNTKPIINHLSAADAEFLWCWLHSASSGPDSDCVPEKDRQQSQIIALDAVERESETVD